MDSSVLLNSITNLALSTQMGRMSQPSSSTFKAAASPAPPTESPPNDSSFDFSIPQRSIDLYAAQCGVCFKWRLIANVEEYEKMRSKMLEEPFICSKKLGISCDDVADIEKDNSRIWAIDRPSIPPTPPGFTRKLLLRSDFYELDVHYVTPTGTKVSSFSEVTKYLEENPQIKGVSVADFSFTLPEVAEDTIPTDAPEIMAFPQARL